MNGGGCFVMADNRNCYPEWSLPGISAVSEALLRKKAAQASCSPGVTLSPFSLEKGGALGWISLL